MIKKKAKFRTDVASQCLRLLEWLEKKPITTLEAREQVDILGVAQRIWDLRNKHGKNIKTDLIMQKTSCGIKHRVARYSLMSGRWKGKGGRHEKH